MTLPLSGVVLLDEMRMGRPTATSSMMSAWRRRVSTDASGCAGSIAVQHTTPTPVQGLGVPFLCRPAHYGLVGHNYLFSIPRAVGPANDAQLRLLEPPYRPEILSPSFMDKVRMPHPVYWPRRRLRDRGCRERLWSLTATIIDCEVSHFTRTKRPRRRRTSADRSSTLKAHLSGTRNPLRWVSAA